MLAIQFPQCPKTSENVQNHSKTLESIWKRLKHPKHLKISKFFEREMTGLGGGAARLRRGRGAAAPQPPLRPRPPPQARPRPWLRPRLRPHSRFPIANIKETLLVRNTVTSILRAIFLEKGLTSHDAVANSRSHSEAPFQ